jgi:hypothetical protein
MQDKLKRKSTRAEILKFCEEWDLERKYIKWNDHEGKYDIYYSLQYCKTPIPKISIPLGYIEGNFIISPYTELTTLENSPVVVGGTFDITGCYFKDLTNGPKVVERNLNIGGRHIVSLKGLPKEMEIFIIKEPVPNLALVELTNLFFVKVYEIIINDNVWKRSKSKQIIDILLSGRRADFTMPRELIPTKINQLRNMDDRQVK